MIAHEYVKQLSVPSNQTYRGMCPSCGSPNTFTATNTNGTVRFNCYRASCDVAGRVYKGATLDDLTRELKRELSPPDSGLVVFDPPEYFVLVDDRQTAARAFMERYSLDKPCTDGRISIRYDPKLDRIVFLITDPLTGMTVDAVGRALQPGIKPKWYRYGKTKDSVFVVYPSGTAAITLDDYKKYANVAVIVEDCVSACTVSHIAIGMAILGTNVPDRFPGLLRSMGISRIIIALDPDAAAKAIDIQRHLCYYFDTKVWLIKDDLKYYSKDRLIKEVGGLLI